MAARVVIFAKAPIPGFAKTRLIPSLGAEGAARLARHMIINTISETFSAGVGHVELCVTPDISLDVWKSLSLPASVAWTSQGEGNLGERMSRAAGRVVGQGDAIILVGTDCPGLDATQIQRAAEQLDDVDAIMIPAVDGGYVLLGLRKFHKNVFETISWSTPSVADETLFRISQLGWSVATLAPLNDIDDPADLQWLPPEWRQHT